MNSNSNPKTAASCESGNAFTSSTRKWLAFLRAPDDDSALNQLGLELDRMLRQFLPGGNLLGLLKGAEEDIRQEAGLLLFNRFLIGNKQLVAATRIDDHSEIESQLRRSVWMALKIVTWRFRRNRGRQAHIIERHTQVNAGAEAVCIHPAHRQSIGELPIDLQQQLVRASLRRAVHERRLDAKSANLVDVMLEKNLSQADLARAHGVSRAAIHQRLAPVRRYLRAAIQEEEFPLS